MPLPSVDEFIGPDVTQQGFKDAQKNMLEYISDELPTKTDLETEVSAVELKIQPKADKTYVDTALASFQNGAIKTYPTLSAANADIANIALNTKVSVLSETDGGDYYKATANATSLTKSPYDSLVKANTYTDNRVDNLGITHKSLESISVAIVDEDDNRTWLEADGAGKPTSYAAQNIIEIAEPSIEQKIQAEKPIIVQEAVLQATQETLEQVGIEQRSFESISVAIVDKDDTRTWLEADETGKPTDYSKSMLVEALDNDIAQKLADSGIGQSSSVGISVAVVDEDDNRTWLEADEAGKPTHYAAQQIAEAIQFDDVVTPSSLKSIYQDALIKVASGPDIDCDGDSMTAGAGGNGTSFPSVLGQLMSSAGSKAVVRNSGVGGESSVSITARMGGYAFQVRVIDGVIPATTTPVVITFDQLNGQIVRPLMQGNGGASGFIGDLAGIKGSIALIRPNGSSNSWDNANYYTFTRLVAGNAVTVNRPEPFITDYAKARQGDIKIIWIGQNGPSEARAIQDAKAIVQSMQALDKRYIVISKPTASSSDDALWFAEFGERFIPIKKYLVEFGLQDAGITPTEQDLADIAANNIPSSLRSDAVHWNSAGYTILAQQVFKKLKQLGWI